MLGRHVVAVSKVGYVKHVGGCGNEIELNFSQIGGIMSRESRYWKDEIGVGVVRRGNGVDWKEYVLSLHGMWGRKLSN